MIDKQDLLDARQDLMDVRAFLESLAAGSKAAVQKDKKYLKAKEDQELIERLLMVVDIKLKISELVKDEAKND